MSPALAKVLMVGLGGMIGSISRYLLTLGCQRFSIVFPLGTFISNVVGCFVIGVLGEFFLSTEVLTPSMRLLLVTGFCGGFTTMSSLVYETGQMLGSRELLHASSYLFGTMAACFAAFYVGILATRIFLKFAGGLWN